MQKLLVLVSCLYLLCACSTPFDSGVSGSTPLKDITPEEEESVCAAMNARYEEMGVEDAIRRFGCTIFGIFAGMNFGMDMDPETDPDTDTDTEEDGYDELACATAMAACMAQTEDGASGGEGSSDGESSEGESAEEISFEVEADVDFCEMDFGDCEATLDDFEACMMAQWEEFQTLAESTTCKEGENGPFGALIALASSSAGCNGPKECDALFEACPEYDPCAGSE